MDQDCKDMFTSFRTHFGSCYTFNWDVDAIKHTNNTGNIIIVFPLIYTWQLSRQFVHLMVYILFECIPKGYNYIMYNIVLRQK